MAGLPQSGLELVAKGASSFVGDLGRAAGAATGFGTALDGAAGRSSAFGQIVTGALREVGALATRAMAEAARATAAFVGGGVSAAGDFEQTLNVLGATSGATADELEAVSDRALALGADLTLPTTSAGDAAQVMLELSKAGMTVQESMDAAKGALQLAAAAQTDNATAAGIVAGALNTFNLEASQSVRVADLLAGGANASSASMTDLAQGLQQGGFAFAAAQMPIDDLITSLAALTNVGLTGSDAGTALKNALMRLMDPTDKAAALMADLGFSAYDANGVMKPMPLLIRDLKASLAGMTDEQRNAALGNIFLSDGMKAMIPLLALGEEGFTDLKAAVSEQGAAAAVAEAQTAGFNGALSGLKSQAETLQIIIGQKLLPTLTPLLRGLGELVGIAAAFVQGGPASFAGLTSLGSFLAQINAPLGSFVANLAIATDPAQALRDGVAGLLERVSQLPTPLGIVVGLLLTAHGALSPVVAALMDAGPASSEFAEALGALLAPLGVTQETVFGAFDAFERLGGAVATVAGILSGEVPGAVGGAQGALGGLITFVLGTVVPGIATVAEWFAANLPAGIATGTAAFTTAQGVVGTVMPAILGIVTGVIGLVTAVWARWGDEITTITSGAFQAVQGVIQVVLGVIQGLIAIATAAITGDWTGQMSALQSANTTIWQGIQNVIAGILNAIAGLFSSSLSEIVSTWDSNIRRLPEIAQIVITQAMDAFRSALGEAPGIGRDIVNGIADGITAAASILAARAAAAARQALESAKAALNIKSPSGVFADEVGRPIAEGIGVGFMGAMAPVQQQIAASVSPAAMPPSMAGGASRVSGALDVNLSMAAGLRDLIRAEARAEANIVARQSQSRARGA